MPAKSRKEQLEEMLTEEPSDPFLHYGLAMEYVSAGDDRTAVERFQQLLAVAADYVPAYLQAGQALVRLNRVAEAKEMWGRGVAAARQKGDTHAAEEMTGMMAALE